MKKKRMISLSIVIIIFAVFLLFVGAAGQKLILHEQEQKAVIARLQEEISELEAEIDRLKNPVKAQYSDTAFNYLAIGNSITKHALADYWWNEIGMAASTIDKDYVHRVAAYLEDVHGEVCFDICGYYAWEIQALDRAETFSILDEYLDRRLDLITIQLSENVTNMETYEADYEELIRHIQEKAPHAQILVIDEFWDGAAKSVLKEEAARQTGVQFVSLAEIRGNPEYQSKIGTTVYDAEGREHEVNHGGVAAHPGDKGMEYIANAVISAIKTD